jgi:molybdopterin-guanine dinucleotide biosynthesis protein A
MGRDKALLPVVGTGELLWQRQLRVLNELQPKELFWSGPVREGMPAHVHVVADVVPDAGPLAGISACLGAMRSDLLIVLAVDLPQMTSVYLSRVLGLCSTDCGMVAKHGDFYEPLAAVYPKMISCLADEHLRDGRNALQDFVSAGLQRRLMESFELEPEDEIFFKNVNRPEDL